MENKEEHEPLSTVNGRYCGLLLLPFAVSVGLRTAW
jgi:hypothetical protein